MKLNLPACFYFIIFLKASSLDSIFLLQLHHDTRHFPVASFNFFFFCGDAAFDPAATMGSESSEADARLLKSRLQHPDMSHSARR